MTENLVFPLAGFGTRFVKEGYTQTKPLIHAGKKTLIEWALESVIIDDNVNLIFIVRKDQCIINGIDSFLNQLYPNCKVIQLDKSTNGSLETVDCALEQINLEGHLHIHTSDIVIPNSINLSRTFQEDIDAATYTFKANNPNYSYCKLNEKNPHIVDSMVEKEIISQVANVGIYSFKSIDKFKKYSKILLQNNTRVKNEFYISSVFELLINNGAIVKSIEVPEIHIVGTPSELKFFSKFVLPTMNPKTIGLVADHSGYLFKKELQKLFEKSEYKIVDYGCFSDLSCDYSDYVPIACKGLMESEVDLVIGSCKSGQGVNISANHQNNIISVIPTDKNSLKEARKHNCPNFLSFPSNNWTPQSAYETFINVFKNFHFEGGRHSTRIQKALDS